MRGKGGWPGKWQRGEKWVDLTHRTGMGWRRGKENYPKSNLAGAGYEEGGGAHVPSWELRVSLGLPRGV